MSTLEANEDSKGLPKPVALSPEQARQIAAGIAYLLPETLAIPILAGPYPVGPELGGFAGGIL